MFSYVYRSFIFFVIAGVSSMPYSEDPLSRNIRSPGYGSGSFSYSDGGSAASSSAFSSASSSVIPGPGSSGSFNAKTDYGTSYQSTPSYLNGINSYAGNFGYGKNDYSNYITPSNPNYGTGGQSNYNYPGYSSGFSAPSGYGGGCIGCGTGGFNGYRGGGGGYGFGGSGSGAGGSSFSSSGGGFGPGFSSPSGSFAGGSGGFPSNFGQNGFYFPPFMPFDFSSFMQQFYANAKAHEEFIRKQAQAHGSDVSSNDVGGVGANAFGQIGPQGGYGAASVHPAPVDGLNERFGGGDRESSPNRGPVSSTSGTFPPPKGNFQGISTFSSSGQSDINGKKTSYKTSSVSVNDNGKVTTYTAHDP